MLRLLLLPLLCGFLVTSSFGEIITPAPGVGPFTWTRGDTNTLYSGWNNFTDDEGDSLNGFQFDNTPQFFSASNPAPVELRELNGVTSVISSLNLYASAGDPSFQVSIPSFNLGSNYTTRVVAQFKTQGTEIDFNQVFLDGVAFTGVQELSRVQGGNPFSGPFQIVETLVYWDLSYAAAQHALTFDSSSGLSLDQLHIDGAVTAVPEPGSIALLGVVAAAGGWSWRRRKRHVKTA